MTTDLNTYKWISATAKMGITDVMWSYSINIDGDASNIPPWEMLEYLHPTTRFPLIRCIPTSHEISEYYPDIATTIEGYSYAVYLSNPIPLPERQSKITLCTSADKDSKGNSREGDIKSYENPETYLRRIWALNNTKMELIFQSMPNPPDKIEDGDTTKYALKKQYTFDAHPINELVSKIASDYNRVFFEKLTNEAAGPKHSFYIIDFEKIDELLGLPTEPLILHDSDIKFHGLPGPRTTRDMTDCKNVIWVELCRKKDNAWFWAERKRPGVIAGTEDARILVYRSSDLLPDPAAATFIDPLTGNELTDPKGGKGGCVTVITGYENQTGGISFGTKNENDKCQAICNAKADEILADLDIDVRQYSVSFQISDSSQYELQLYQKVIIYGFPNSIPHEILRITDIEYNYTNAGDGGDSVSLVLVPDIELQAARRFEMMQDELRSNSMALKQSIERNVINNKMGLVKSLSQGRVYANLELRSSGRMVQTRAWGERIKK